MTDIDHVINYGHFESPRTTNRHDNNRYLTHDKQLFIIRNETGHNLFIHLPNYLVCVTTGITQYQTHTQNHSQFNTSSLLAILTLLTLTRSSACVPAVAGTHAPGRDKGAEGLRRLGDIITAVSCCRGWKGQKTMPCGEKKLTTHTLRTDA